MEQKTIKQCKLHGKRRPSSTRAVPWLNINGFWLEKAGFGVGQAVEITVEEKQLIIKAVG